MVEIVKATIIGGTKFTVVHSYERPEQAGTYSGIYWLWSKRGAGDSHLVGWTVSLSDLSRIWREATGTRLAGPLGRAVHFA